MISSVSNSTASLESTGGLQAAELFSPRLPGHKGGDSNTVSLAERHIVARGLRSSIESVIGSDDRTRILETNLSPWRQICALEIEGSNGARFIGTGWLAGPKTLITAGHCVHHPDLGGWAQRITVSPGRNGDDFPFERVTSTQFSAIDAWTAGQNPDFDYGAIHLDVDIGTQLGWFAIDALSDAQLAQRRLNISGYPGTPGFGRQQWFHSNGVLRTSEMRIFYDVDTSGGQSGAPVWLYPDGSQTPLVVGIHAYGVGETPPNFQMVANSAPRITEAVLELIESWVNGD